jgi:hypothetical protein
MAAVAALLIGVVTLSAQRGGWFVESRDHPAISYSQGPAANAIVELNRRIREGDVALTFTPVTGYLESTLEALRIPRESQVAVFSPTSFQASRIHEKNPRSVFFNDTVSVGWVRTGTVLEVAAQDDERGIIFYALDQTETSVPQFKRNDDCLACHLTRDTLGVPGLVAYSVLPLADERAYRAAYVSDHRSPLADRWGGWYVTGARGVEHMGNRPTTGYRPAPRDQDAAPADTPDLVSLDGEFDTQGYLTPYSDIVALMVLEHQTHMTNLITRMGWETRVAGGSAVEASSRAYATALELVDYLLFVDEAPLDGLAGEDGRPYGQSGFADVFGAGEPRDSRGRSLRQFDLDRRLMRYPCSFLIYTPAFDALPPAALDVVYRRLWQVLSGEEQGPRYQVLSRADRQAVVEILRETKTGLPAYFAGDVAP